MKQAIIDKIRDNGIETDFNFDYLIDFLDKSDITFKDVKLKQTLGIATDDCVYLDVDNILKKMPNIGVYYVVLHEVAHNKRIKKFGGKKAVINYFSLDNFSDFSEHIINEELIADRYACFVFRKMMGFDLPKYMTQQLDIKINQELYRENCKKSFGKINNDEKKYDELLNSFMIDG
jgi:hypothetical protein